MDSFTLPTLLLISENPSLFFWFRKQLKEQFFIVEAFTFTLALNAAKNSKPDFVIIDSDFENFKPLHLCHELRQIVDLCVPILLITGKLKKSFLETALESGVTDFLNSQLDADELQQRIATAKKAGALRKKTNEAFVSLAQNEQPLSSNYLKNKSLLHDQALRLIGNAKKNKIPLVALFIRIDHFETIQKQLGYLAVPEISLFLSNLLLETLKKSDLFIPSGDKAFIILLQNTTVAQAKTIAENFRAKVARTPFQSKNEQFPLSVSMTLSSIDATEGNFNKMIQMSVTALKEADAAANLIIPIEP